MKSIRSSRRMARSLRLLLPVFAALFVLIAASSAYAVTFDPGKLMGDDTFRDSASMTQADIQAFLKAFPNGVLASYTATDYASGQKVLASQIIYNASQKFHINPRVLLIMLQKEQSLLTNPPKYGATSRHPTLDWALGMGCPDGYSTCFGSGCHSTTPPDNRYPEYAGFGKQIYAAAWNLDAYGVKGKTRPTWHHASSPTSTWPSNWVPGSVYMGLYVPGGTLDVALQTLATYKLYKYNPSIGAKTPYGDLAWQAGSLEGNSDFWWLYRKYFGDTFANPRLRLVYRLRDVRTGAYLYTRSAAERYNLTRTGRYKYEKVAFSINSSNTANSVPVYRFMNRKTRGYYFTTSTTQVARMRAGSLAKRWRYEGVAFSVSKNAAGTVPVYQFNNRKTGLPFLTTSSADKAKFLTKTYRKKWAYKGVAFSIAP